MPIDNENITTRDSEDEGKTDDLDIAQDASGRDQDAEHSTEESDAEADPEACSVVNSPNSQEPLYPGSHPLSA